MFLYKKFFLLQNLTGTGVTWELVSEDKEEVKISRHQEGEEALYLVLDKTTWYPRQVMLLGEKGEVQARLLLNEWRRADGIAMPFKAVLEEGGHKSAELELDEVKFNSGLSDEVFDEPLLMGKGVG